MRDKQRLGAAEPLQTRSDACGDRLDGSALGTAAVPGPNRSRRRRQWRGRRPAQLRLLAALAQIQQIAQIGHGNLRGTELLVAAAAALGQQRAFDLNGAPCGRVIDCCEQLRGRDIIGATFDAERALGRRGRAGADRQDHARQWREQLLEQPSAGGIGP